MLHGGLSRAERAGTELAFRSGAARLLIATDAAGEGLNLHHRCRLVVNLELPWNPMRLEQRIGRVDRLGQSRRPHAIHLLAHETAEERIVWRLVERQERARRSVGAVSDVVGVVREDQVAAAVIAGDDRVMASHPPPAGHPAITHSSAVRDLGTRGSAETTRLQMVRTLTLAPPRRVLPEPHTCGSDWGERSEPAGVRPLISTLRHRAALRLGAGLACVFVVGLFDGRGEFVDQWPVVVQVRLADRSVLDSRTALDRLVFCPAVTSCLEAAAAQRFALVGPAHARLVRLALDRERALVALERRQPTAFQPGMFDRRAVDAAERGREQRETRESECRERAAALVQAARGVSLAPARLALVLVVR